MHKYRRLAFDMSSYLKTALLTGKDQKDGLLVEFEGKQVLVNSAEYGYEIVINMMTKTLSDCNAQPRDCLLVFEGLNSKSPRLAMYKGYKAKRDKRPPEFYEEFGRLRDYVEEVWRDLGAIAMSKNMVEADDVLAYLARETQSDLIIASRDADLGALSGVNEHGATISVYNDGEIDLVKLDGELFVHPAKYITLYKALVGDSSDNIPGVANFGPARFQKLAEQYGYDGLDELMGMLEKQSLGDVAPLLESPEHKLLRLIDKDSANAFVSWKLAKMYPEWVHINKPLPNALQIRPGKVKDCPADADRRLQQWYGLKYLVTTEEYHEAAEFFREQIRLSRELVFDIETSTPPESDEWLAALDDEDGVDQLGSVLTGFSFTFGSNQQHTLYLSVDHRDTKNVPMSLARQFIEIAIESQLPIVIHNTFFELCVLHESQDEDGSLWRDHWSRYGEHGFLPRVLDTKLEASYVNENISNGLKFRSKHHLGYVQTSYEATVTKEGRLLDLPSGGKIVEVMEWLESPASAPETEAQERTPLRVKKRYKMRELIAEEVVDYGCDDTICTSALHNYFRLIMELEKTWQVYLDTEILPAYMHAKTFVDGMGFSLETMRKQEAHDSATFDKAWSVVREYLLRHGWEGTVPPVYGPELTPAQIKEAYKIVVLGSSPATPSIGDLPTAEDEDSPAEAEAEEEDETPKDAFLATRVRTPLKLVVMLQEMGHHTFAGMVERCLQGEHEAFTAWVKSHFTGEPQFTASNKQMQKLLYEVMGLPVRVRNKPTKLMRSRGELGSPKGDSLAIEYALREATPEQKAVLESLKLMQMVTTRRNLFYKKYPYFIHWKTGRIHPSHNQCQTNTRRASESKPNKQQLPKHPKIEGQASQFRECIMPHHPDAVVVSLDFDSQELRVIADYSQDENMVACYVGDHKKDMHALTGHQIAVKKKMVEVTLSYEEFAKAAKTEDHPLHKVCKTYRALGKKVNFTTEFGAMAPKLAVTMLVTEQEAQTYIDAKEAMFPGVRRWKDSVIEASKRDGIVRTKGGAVRHLADAYMSDDHWIRSKAERQSVNFEVQSSSAEMTKRAEGRMWKKGLTFAYDCVCYGPIHDECVFSVMKVDLLRFLEEAHWCMTQPYADMTIPIESSISFGPSFGLQIEIGTKPTAEAVAKGFEQMEKAIAKAKAERAANA